MAKTKRKGDQGWITYLGALAVIGCGAAGYLHGDIDFYQGLLIIGAGLSIAGVRNYLAKLIRELRG